MLLVIKPSYLPFFYKLREHGNHGANDKPLHILTYGI